MANLISRVAGSTFARAAAVLSGGQSLAAMIPLAAAPILGRLYRPSEYGAFGAYIAISTVVGSLSTLQLHQAVLTQSDESEAYDIARTVMVVASFAAVLSIFASAWLLSIASTTAFAQARWWALALPFTVFSAGQAAAASMLANRAKQFWILARLPVIPVFLVVIVSITAGIVGLGVHGLFLGYIAGQFVSFVLYRRVLRMLRPLHLRPKSLQRHWATLKAHRNYPLYTAPSEFIGSFNMQAPVFALGFLNATAAIGSFTRARQLIGMPLQVIGSSIAQVFRQRAAELRNTTGTCRGLYQRTFWTLLALGLPMTVFLMVFAPYLFRWVLGPAWESAGHLARIIAPALLLQFVCSPLSTVFYIAERQREEFGLAFGALMLQVFTIAVAIYFIGTAEAILGAYAASFCATYLTYIVRGWQISGQPKEKLTP